MGTVHTLKAWPSPIDSRTADSAELTLPPLHVSHTLKRAEPRWPPRAGEGTGSCRCRQAQTQTQTQTQTQIRVGGTPDARSPAV
ncbi:hypothetical protein P8C59_006010 [Phyllachora maydis]|uniref:Uncharacterized protein n=1 Tax=Phyllachora maydis TaxID=1825666 RepID=A0AAD9I5J0_9PEZI|nr:hypothetical protein P8C59_006010 [Phyllachora maydis]